MFDDLHKLHDDIFNNPNGSVSHDNSLDTGQTVNHDVFYDTSIYDYTHTSHDASDINYYNSFDNYSSDIHSYPDSSIHHATFHSASDSDNTVYHEHYWKKPRILDITGDGGESYDSHLPPTSLPEPENQGCIDNNNDGQCDSSTSSGSGSD